MYERIWFVLIGATWYSRRLAELPLHIGFLGKAEAAMRLDARLAGRPGRFRAEQLRHVGFLAWRQPSLEFRTPLTVAAGEVEVRRTEGEGDWVGT
jgi:hypothetical protein